MFSIEGLTNEYMGEAIVLREGKVTRIPTLTEVETLKSWTPLLAVIGVVGFVCSLILAFILPLT